MKRRKPGRKHTLLLYQRMMDRLWGATLMLGMLMLALWFWSDFFFPELSPIFKMILLIGAVYVLTFTVLAIVARKMAYVQAYPDHLRVVTPFLRLKASYQRLLRTHPSEFFRLFPASQARWSDRQYLEPFYNQTAVVVEFSQYPMSLKVLRLFLLPQMFSPQAKALVFIVSDWMALSTEIDSALSTFKQVQSANQKPAQTGYGLMGSYRKR